MKKIFDLGHDKVVRQYPYRTARVSAVMISIDRNSDAGRELEQLLSKKAEADPDNHVVYEVRHKYNESIAPLYFSCSDLEIDIGSRLLEGRW